MTSTYTGVGDHDVEAADGAVEGANLFSARGVIADVEGDCCGGAAGARDRRDEVSKAVGTTRAQPEVVPTTTKFQGECGADPRRRAGQQHAGGMGR